MNLRKILSVVLVVCLVVGAGVVFLDAFPIGQQGRPNIVLIVSDDQGYHDLGSFGNETIETPHLDQLAEEGVRLTSFYMTASVCTPSRSGLLTGRYPQRNGTFDLFRNKAVDFGYQYNETTYATSPERVLGMDTREVLLSEVLSEGGYTNGIFGKWDLGQLRRFLPLQQGFDDFYGFVNTGIDYYTHERYGIHAMYRNNKPTKEDQGTYATDLFEREAVRFLKENHDDPFFLYLPFNAPHFASNLNDDDPHVHAPEDLVQIYTDVGVDEAEAYHMASITAMDEVIGNVLGLLEDYGVSENTIVLFMSDHGGSGLADNGPLRGNKGDMFEGGLRAPCIIRWPGEIPAGTVSDEFLTALEVFPTLVDIAGADRPEGVELDGFNMLSVLKGEAESERNKMFWRDGFNTKLDDRAARVGSWKWVLSEEDTGLYDLSQDLGEQDDLSDERPEVLADVKKEFSKWQATMEASEPRRPFRNF